MIMEDKYTEYKLKYSPQIGILICAFLNTDGGKIFIGYNEQGDFVGISNVLEVENQIKNIIEKQFLKFKNHIKVEQHVKDGHSSIIVIISKANNEKDGFAFITSKTNEKNYYFRVGQRNIKTDKEHAPYWEIIGIYDFPVYKDYTPSDKEKKNEFDSIKKQNNVIYQQIGKLRKGHYFYKYMDLESALRSLEMKQSIEGEREEKKPNLRFVEPTSWDDQYEGRFYNAIYDGKRSDPKTTPFLYACCFSTKRENEAAWILYSHNRTGLASRCVELTINRAKLREQLVKHLRNCSLYIGMVNYQNKETIDNIHMPYLDEGQDNPNYHKYFGYFTLERYLDLLLLKRTAFEHEQEVRIFIIPNEEKNNVKARREQNGEFKSGMYPKPKFVDIDWIDIIENIKIDKNCTDYEIALLQEKIDVLVQEKQGILKEEDYNKLKEKMKLVKFDPYKDDSLEIGPLQVNTKKRR